MGGKIHIKTRETLHFHGDFVVLVHLSFWFFLQKKAVLRIEISEGFNKVFQTISFPQFFNIDTDSYIFNNILRIPLSLIFFV